MSASSPPGPQAAPPPFHTIGHSARSVDQLVGLLALAGVRRIVDVRAFPRSRANPQFNLEALPAALQGSGIDYVHLEALGGRRHKGLGEASPNGWWSHASFRNYADYAHTEGFLEGMQALLQVGRERPCALMCSEAVWWRCHRRIITDYLLAGGETVLHILSETSIRPASMTPAAVTRPDGSIVYPPEAD